MKQTKLIFTVCFILLGCAAAMAQPNGNGQGGGGTAPIDNGIMILVLGIAIYGAKMIRDDRKVNNVRNLN